MNPDTRERIRENREDLEALADSDLPAAAIGRALLRVAEQDT